MPLVDKETERLIDGLREIQPDDEEVNALALEAKRILHSLKAYAEHKGSMELAAACHDLERDLRSGGLEALIEGLPYVEAIAANLAQDNNEQESGVRDRDGDTQDRGTQENEADAGTSADAGASAGAGDTQPAGKKGAPRAAQTGGRNAHPAIVKPARVLLDLRERSVLNDLTKETLTFVRIRISADEPMPKARSMLVLRELEEVATIIRTEVWLGGNPAVDPRAWLDTPLGDMDPEGEFGAFIRCLLVPHGDMAGLQKSLDFDLVDECFCDPAPEHLDRDWPNPEIESDLDLARQKQHLLNRRFMPGPRGMTVRAYVDFMQAWKESEKLLFALESEDLSPVLEDFVKTESLRHPEHRFALSCERIPVHPELTVHIKDMLLQLIRNSLAHGRRDDGSPLLLHIDVYQSGNKIVVQYSDDGRGIDPVALAWKEGLETGALVSDEGILHIISRPGFSSRDKADVDAGYGTGLDLVRHLVEERLRGSWNLKNKFGQGCRFTLNLPAAMYPMDVLVCEAGAGFLALPMASVLARIGAKEAGYVAAQGGRRELFYRGILCKLVLTQTGQDPDAYVILRRVGADPVAIGVQSTKGKERAFFETNSASVYSRKVGRWIPYFTEDDQV